ncbi:hypothetical protein U9M48_010328 [Paspalum notatum var. saurae]|uniref:Uncharacterized protein n=1 Tax=Paspalum notatum var. saurae TaxID=547442 RepID=A0AAQ3WG52_PASNO
MAGSLRRSRRVPVHRLILSRSIRAHPLRPASLDPPDAITTASSRAIHLRDQLALRMPLRAHGAGPARPTRAHTPPAHNALAHTRPWRTHTRDNRGPPQMAPTADEPAPPPPTSPWVILGSIPRVAEDEAVPDICRAPAGVAPDSALPRPRRRHRRRAPLRTTTRRSPSSKPRRGRYYAVADLLPLIGSDTAHLRCFFSDLGEWVDRQARLRIPARQGVAVDGWSLA